MTVAGFLIALGALVFVISSVSMFMGTLIELTSVDPLTGRYGDDDPLAEVQATEVHDLLLP